MTHSISIVAAVNDDAILERDLAASPIVRDGRAPLHIERGHASAASALNAGLEKATADVVVCAHQDVYLPPGWAHRLAAAIASIEEQELEWGVLGLIGKSFGGDLIGRVYSSGLHAEIGTAPTRPHPVISIDEMVIAIRRDAGLRFDERLPGFHLYGTDLVLTGLARGYPAYVFHGPAVHNSRGVFALDRSYDAAYQFMQRKWRGALPVPTCVVPVTRWGWPLLRRRLRVARRVLAGHRHRPDPHPDPAALARELGYPYEPHRAPALAGAAPPAALLRAG